MDSSIFVRFDLFYFLMNHLNVRVSKNSFHAWYIYPGNFCKSNEQR